MVKVCHSLVSMPGTGAGWSGDIAWSGSLEDELLLLEVRGELAAVIFVLSKRGLASCLLGDRCNIDRLARVVNDFSAILSELASSTAVPW
jgi:hypothetical protein